MTSKSSDYYNRPLEGKRRILPIDTLNQETGHKDGDSDDSSGDDEDYGYPEDGEDGEEGKKRKGVSQQR